MATEKTKAEKEYTVEERLKTLYELQTMLSEIDRIKTLRGELPLEVKDLEDEIARLETRVQKFQGEIVQLQSDIAKEKEGIKNSQTLIEKYTAQQDNVRNNREFDFLTKEIEYQNLSIELCEKHIREYTAQEKNKKEEIETCQTTIAERTTDLQEKKEELDEIIAETRQDEEKLREKAKKLEQQVDPRLLSAFKRIRKNARNGLAVVYIQRGACGGCFNKIPPQRQLDIKMHKKIIVCEYCGRIMIDPELAGVQE
ncbi:MAG TPA: hypothetical protein IAD09_09155 [Candidatus Caccoplasma merdavium]|nr:hypothetical protein [Candidatus Caccoplasma merdavium]